ncbi:transglutaminase TgpA family protein [Halobaculum sp. D14]|uniref:transglutaminase TgpA family protein n=1 Tax=Halobaculum sp. D14 TaxID=3421642 RepID=UPI003EBA987F
MSGGTEGLTSIAKDATAAATRSDRGRGSDGHGRASYRALVRPPAAGVALVVASFLSVFFHVTDVVGGSGVLAMELALATLAAVWLGRTLRPRTAAALAAAGLAVGLTGYFFSVPESARALFTAARVLADLRALLTGLSVLRLLNVGAWALFLAPVPTFLAAALTVRRRYVSAATVAAATTGFFALTGDAGVGAILAAAVGATLTAGFAGLDTAGWRGVSAQWDTLAVVVAAMVVVTSAVTVVPGSGANPVLPGGQSPTVESSLVTNSDRVGVLGSIRLSPEVRFVVEADRSAYWRVGAYDRYTGGGWVRTGGTTRYSGDLASPPGETERLVQEVTAKAKLNAMPAAWKPVSVRNAPVDTMQVTDLDGLKPGTALLVNDTYTVVSETPTATPAELRRAGVDYPSSVQQRYTGLPESTPDRVANRTARILDEANATTPYDAAVAVERYLESTKSYSLDVPAPRGSVADRFLFEMESGYCVYYATTMAVMLRTQGIPARFVTGYTPGQRVAEDEWVVRGLDSHAWVEVYFPEHGWVRFDPTPGGPRESAEQESVEEARASGESGVDAAGSEDGTYSTPTPTPEPGSDNGTAAAGNIGVTPFPSGAGGLGITPAGPGGITGSLGRPTTGGGAAAGDDGGWQPTRGDAVLIGALVVGVVAGARRFGLTGRAYRAVWLLHQSPGEPAADAERAYRRLEYLGAVAYRPRQTGETPRQYVDALARDAFGDTARTVGSAYERATYGGGVTADEAATAVDATDRLVREHAPVLRRF